MAIIKQDYGQLYGGELAVESLIAPVQKTLTADKLYNIGDQFIYDDRLYKVTVAIPQYDPIVIGTNAVVADNITEQMKNNRYRVVKTATANTTYGSQCTELKTAFDQLSTEEKLHSAILWEAFVYPCINTNFIFGTTYVSSSGTGSHLYGKTFGGNYAVDLSDGSMSVITATVYNGSLVLIVM